MSKPRIISPAEREYMEALGWYAERSRRADEEFDRVLNAIIQSPRRFPRCDNRHRYCLMGRYPYQVIYREEANEVVVIAVAHAKRKPEYWAGG